MTGFCFGRLIASSELPPEERDHVICNLDAVIRDYKTRMAYATY